MTVAALLDDFDLRPARAEDVPAVAALEAELFPDPWPRHLFLQEIGQPLRFQRVIVDHRGVLAAYLFACWQADELHILKVATHPDYQRRGLATLLLELAFAEARRQGGRGLILEVRPSNRGAYLLYRRLGYHVLGRRSRYYSDGEDATVMFLPVSDANRSS